MKENENHITDIPQLAETGWKQMHELLRKHGLSTDTVVISPASKKRNLFLPFAASLLLILIFSFPYILNDKFYFSLISDLSTPASSFSNEPAALTQSVKMISPLPQGSKMFLQKRDILSGRPTPVIINSKKETFTIVRQPQSDSYFRKLCSEKIYPAISLQSTVPEGRIDTVKIKSSKKSKTSGSKKVQIFGGAGINAAVGNKNSSSIFDDLNIHPGLTLIVSLSEKWSLHSGLWAFSTVHGKEVSTREREPVNNLGGNLYYNINTTSIIKAAYFDLPVTLHYSINKNWSVGSGVQLSKLYKINIREQKESFDYNNRLFSATVDQYNSTPARAAAVFQKKVEIKKFEPRFVADANFQQHKWLFSVGYYYGFGKTITLRETDNSHHQYRNEYFKLGVQYRIKGNR